MQWNKLMRKWLAGKLIRAARRLDPAIAALTSVYCRTYTLADVEALRQKTWAARF